MGASVALASRSGLPLERPWRSASLWALAMLEGVVVLPVAAFVVHRYPDWSLLAAPWPYWLREPVASVVLLPVAAFASYVVARRLVLDGRVVAATLLALAGLAVAGAVGFLAAEQLTLVPSLGFVAGAPQRLAHTSLAYLLAGGALVVGVAWMVTLARLWQVAAATARAERQARQGRPVRRTSDTRPLANRRSGR